MKPQEHSSSGILEFLLKQAPARIRRLSYQILEDKNVRLISSLE
jgi:hypothetical protein